MNGKHARARKVRAAQLMKLKLKFTSSANLNIKRNNIALTS